MKIVRGFLRSVSSGLAFAVLVLAAAVPVLAQVPENNESVFGKRPQEPPPKSFREMLARQRAEKQKKEYEELLKRGEEAALISQQLEITFAADNDLSPADMTKLETLEKLVLRIRKGLGGDDEDAEETAVNSPVSDQRPSTLKEAFSELKEMTGKMVEEIKKTSRFTVSVVAIQSSNSVLKLVKFLRFRK